MLCFRLGLFSDCGPVDIVHGVRCPLLVMHGTADEVVPCSHGQDIFDHAREPKELWMQPEGRHCEMYDLDKRTYAHKVLGFLERNWPKSKDA